MFHHPSLLNPPPEISNLSLISQPPHHVRNTRPNPRTPRPQPRSFFTASPITITTSLDLHISQSSHRHQHLALNPNSLPDHQAHLEINNSSPLKPFLPFSPPLTYPYYFSLVEIGNCSYSHSQFHISIILYLYLFCLV